MNATTDKMLLDCETCRHRFRIRRSVGCMVTVCPACKHFVIPAEREVRPIKPFLSPEPDAPAPAPVIAPPPIATPTPAAKRIPWLESPPAYSPPIPPEPPAYFPPTPEEQVFAGILSFARWVRFLLVSFVLMFLGAAFVCFLIGHFSY